MVPSSIRQTLASILLMSGVYVSNIVFNYTSTENNTETINPFTPLRSLFIYENVSADTIKPVLGVCRTSDSGFASLAEPYFNDRVFYNRILGRHCRVKLNITIDNTELIVYDLYNFPVHGIYENKEVFCDDDDYNHRERATGSFIYDTINQPIYFEFINKTSVELSFRAHPYDDVSAELSNTGIVIYAIRTDDTVYVVIVGFRVKIYILKYDNERTLTKQYERHIFKILKDEPDCSKYIHCANYVKNIDTSNK